MRTYDFFGCDFCPVKVKTSWSPDSLVSSMRRLQVFFDEGAESVVERLLDVCVGL